MTNSWIVDVKEDQAGQLLIEPCPEILDAAGLKEGDTVQWIDNNDGSWTLQKAEQPISEGVNQ